MGRGRYWWRDLNRSSLCGWGGHRTRTNGALRWAMTGAMAALSGTVSGTVPPAAGGFVEGDGVVRSNDGDGTVVSRPPPGLVTVEWVGVVGGAGGGFDSPVAHARSLCHVSLIGLGGIVNLGHVGGVGWMDDERG